MSEFVNVVVSSDQPAIGTVVLSRPPTNALSRQAYREIAAAATELSRRDDIAAVIIFGGHEIFCAGTDVPELRTLNLAEAESAARDRHQAVEALAAIAKPTVAAITGYALGSGLTLALAADWRVSGDNVKFGATEILAGLIPDGSGLARLTRVIGASRAKELVFSGRFFDAEEALELGLINDMVAPDGVYDAALVWANRFVGSPPQALAAAKAGINEVVAGPPTGEQNDQLRRYLEVFAGQSAVDTGT